MELVIRQMAAPRSLGILPGSFNPPTRAHLELARAARQVVDQVLLVLPRRFPHKEYEGATLEQRMELLRKAAAGCDVGLSDGGLFLEIAQECEQAYGSDTDLWFLCGRDAAERIVTWPYRDPDTLPRMFNRFGLLVADRDGPYISPRDWEHRVRNLRVQTEIAGVSATQVRERVRAGLPWEDWVPESIQEDVRRIYS